VQKARLTDRDGTEHEAQALGAQGSVELSIGRALDVAKALGLDRTADDEKFRGLDHTRHAARL
jgi:hypothetical protein